MVRMFNGFGVDPDKVRLISPFAIEIADGDLVIPESIQRFVDSHSPLLLTVGLLEDTYNLESQIDLMDRIIHELPGTGLLIVGSGSLEPELRERIESKPYKDSILLAGDVPHKITLNLIQTCDILLRTTKFDGDAISVREALYFGTPVIATDNRMRPKGVNLISSPLDGEELVEKIIELSSCRDRDNPRSGTDGRENIESVVGLYDELFKS
jgi:glycosyltransferase involved in cell wall biosynthesis